MAAVTALGVLYVVIPTARDAYCEPALPGTRESGVRGRSDGGAVSGL